MSRIAVVLFNLGGPDSPKAVRPFLRNLFSDPAIIGAPTPVRLTLAEVVSRSREKLARRNYGAIGGASPLMQETQAQAVALAGRLSAARPQDDVKVFIAMRYWRPLTEDTAREVAAFAPDEVVLTPLYPQFSTTTTASSLAAWARSYAGLGRQYAICCYFDDDAFIEAHVARIRTAWIEAGSPEGVRLLFSARGLPERTSAAGDPYRWQVEQTCAKVASRLGPAWDWRVCYQSRVGPLKWIGPETTEEIEAAAAEGLGVIIDPIAFVSEHVETLVELDRDYAAFAERVSASPYIRVPTLREDPAFIDGLARLIVKALDTEGVHPGASACPLSFARCALREQAPA
jgi:protoporphyrin/coproporphyrin ferrochelatase